MESVILSGGKHQLLALVAAIDPSWNNTPRAVSFVQLQLDIGAGGTRLYVGNFDVTTTNCGVELIAGQAGPNAMTVWGNPISLASIWLLSSSQENTRVNLVIVQA